MLNEQPYSAGTLQPYEDNTSTNAYINSEKNPQAANEERTRPHKATRSPTGKRSTRKSKLDMTTTSGHLRKRTFHTRAEHTGTTYEERPSIHATKP